MQSASVQAMSLHTASVAPTVVPVIPIIATRPITAPIFQLERCDSNHFRANHFNTEG